MKYLIIGSKGFVGAKLQEYLLSIGQKVKGADVIVDYNYDDYYLLDASNCDFKFIFEKEDFDICINCSGAASVPDSINNPLRDYFLNTVNVFKILTAIKEYQPNCKFINLSSAAIYGNPIALPITEVSEVNPLSPYGIHKKQSEEICKEFHDFFNIKTCSLRIFSAYGPGLKKQLFWDLHKKSKSEEKIKLYGSGNESRDFIYISDLVIAIELISKSNHFKGEAINVANGKEIFIKDCVSSFYGYFDEFVDYEFSGNSRKGDPNNWCSDISILKELGYKQSVNIEQGLLKYYKWLKEIE